MRKRDMAIALLAGGLALATRNLTAQSTDPALPARNPPGMGDSSQHAITAQPTGTNHGAADLKASGIIGLGIRSESGERLGKVEDLIVRLASQSVPFAIVDYGGATGVGEIRVAVPLKDFKWSSESRELTLSATREQFESASRIPTGAWMAVAGEDCLKNIDRFYGEPSISSQSRYERQEATSMAAGREAVRNAATEKGSTVNSPDTNTLGKLTHDYLVDKVNEVIRQTLGASAGNVQMTIKNGLVTLRGKVASEAQKQVLENQIKAVAGVNEVENKLWIGPE